ncbi:hypothetical protein B0J11DRAFT_299857 [Dendryphion nanum]|uniref:Transmembrane protein n=1 Tax=Dendryphion nanum TaxID=256645 RepID=A0A9P9DSK6_9PLEO|nr:hypothetical protein B0J11DRAFT_299857 [Dendryphion nanum]
MHHTDPRRLLTAWFSHVICTSFCGLLMTFSLAETVTAFPRPVAESTTTSSAPSNVITILRLEGSYDGSLPIGIISIFISFGSLVVGVVGVILMWRRQYTRASLDQNIENQPLSTNTTNSQPLSEIDTHIGTFSVSRDTDVVIGDSIPLAISPSG